jgi:hypothetical protein
MYIACEECFKDLLMSEASHLHGHVSEDNLIRVNDIFPANFSTKRSPPFFPIAKFRANGQNAIFQDGLAGES